MAEQVCSTCHGVDGNSTSPEYPKLAGQQPEYLITQLKNIKQHARTDRLAQEVMAGMTRDLTDTQQSEIAVYYSRRVRVKSSSGLASSELGKSLYQQGVAERGVIPCMACHGPNAEGNGAFPQLAGQHSAYLIKQLYVFRDTHGRSGTPMTDVSKTLSDNEIRALASYLSAL